MKSRKIMAFLLVFAMLLVPIAVTSCGGEGGGGDMGSDFGGGMDFGGDDMDFGGGDDLGGGDDDFTDDELDTMESDLDGADEIL